MEQTVALIEVKGCIASIEAVDTIVKSANVQLVGHKQLENGFLMVFTGERKTLLAALEVGVRQAQKFGTVLAHRVIPLPDEQTQKFIERLIGQT